MRKKLSEPRRVEEKIFFIIVKNISRKNDIFSENINNNSLTNVENNVYKNHQNQTQEEEIEYDECLSCQ